MTCPKNTGRGLTGDYNGSETVLDIYFVEARFTAPVTFSATVEPHAMVGALCPGDAVQSVHVSGCRERILGWEANGLKA